MRLLIPFGPSCTLLSFGYPSGDDLWGHFLPEVFSECGISAGHQIVTLETGLVFGGLLFCHTLTLGLYFRLPLVRGGLLCTLIDFLALAFALPPSRIRSM
jgi:hypothetical protein